MTLRKFIPFALGLAVAGLMLSGCVRYRDKPAETLGSFAVEIDWDATAVPGDPYARCTFGQVTDLCPGGPGTEEDPIDFPGDDWAQVVINVEAVGSDGTRPWPLNAPVSLSLAAGSVFGQSRQIVLEEGRAEGVLARFRRTPGPTLLWVEDNLPRFDENDGEPTYAVGLTSEHIYFNQPTLADLQTTSDECCNPMQGQRIEVTSGELYVTSIVGNGFNVQDVTAPQWGGIFTFAFNGIEGLRVGSKLLAIGGAITEFQSSTQLTEPVYTPVNGLCGDPRGVTEGAETGEENESGAARARCPRGSTCERDDEGIERCTPDSDDSLDEFGRRVCIGGQANACPAGTSCQPIEGQGQFCQVIPQAMPAVAFPTAPYCGPINTQQEVDGNGTLLIEALEGSLVKIESTGTLGVRVGGLPACKHPGGDDPIHAVRSSCNLTEEDGESVKAVDCTVAQVGDELLRDEFGQVCFRNNQACLRENDNQSFLDVRSTCNDDPSVPRCLLAEPGDPVLEDDNGRICRNTLDDFLTSGYQTFGQAKVFFEDTGGATRCATVNFDALTARDPLQMMEAGVRWRSITGTLRQVRFRSATSFWVVDARFDEDLEPLIP